MRAILWSTTKPEFEPRYRCRVERTDKKEKFKCSGYSGSPAYSALLYNVQKVLNARGYDLAKVSLSKDGHLTSDDWYLRTRKPATKAPHIYIYDPNYAIRCAGEEFNREGWVELAVESDIFGKQLNCHELIAAIEATECPAMDVVGKSGWQVAGEQRRMS